MALKEPFMFKTHLTSDTAPLEIKAETGQSIMVKRLRSQGLGASEFAEVLIGRLSVGYFRKGLVQHVDNHLEHCPGAYWWGNLQEYLADLGIFKGYPIAEGETFTFKDVTTDINEHKDAMYEIYDAGDITKDMPNGSEATEFSFINYGTNLANITLSKYGDVDFPLNPTEYPNFPFGAAVPAAKEIDIHGILLKYWGGRVDNTADEMRFLRLSKGREVLFDEDRRGIYSTQGMEYFPWHTRQTRNHFQPFPTPITFTEGEELKVELSCGASHDITAKDSIIAFVETVRTVT